MKVTRERKILCGVMVAGLLALVIDRATGSGGGDQSSPLAEGTDAAVIAPPAAATPPRPTSTLASPPATRPAANASLSARIAALARADVPGGSAPTAFRDPFHVPKAWVDNPRPVRNPTPSSAAAFESAHHLTAVVLDGRRSRAVIDGSLLRLGQSVGGHVLVAVTPDLAILECGNSRVALKLERTGGVATADAR
jgi:hypothetical protein